MAPADLDATVRANLARVRERIATACQRAGRDPAGVRLVGVSKYVDPLAAAALVRAGCVDLGEARPQVLWAKAAAPELTGVGVRWRLIGHLQRNKADRTVAASAAIDSVDSLRLLSTLDKAAAAAGKRLPILLEVNVSGDAEKHGFAPADLAEALERLDNCPNLLAEGLMGMAARDGGAEVARHNFATLRELRDRLSTPQRPLGELSMGMSGDLDQAILEGSTMVRVGSALWEGLR